MRPAGFRVRAIHVICTALPLLSAACMMWGLKLEPPVPLAGEPLTFTRGTVFGLAVLIAAITAWQVKLLAERVTVFLVAAFLLPVLGATAIPGLLYALNATNRSAAAEQHLEHLLELRQEHIGKHRERHVLTTRSLDGKTLYQREISTAQYRDIQSRAIALHQPLVIEVADGQLGWRHVRSIKEAATPAQ